MRSGHCRCCNGHKLLFIRYACMLFTSVYSCEGVVYPHIFEGQMSTWASHSITLYYIVETGSLTEPVTHRFS